MRWTRYAWEVANAKKVKATLDCAGVLSKKLCSEAESTDAIDHDASTRSALQRTLPQCGEDEDCLSLHVTQAGACIELQGSTLELHTVEDIESNLKGEATSEYCFQIEEKNKTPSTIGILLCRRNESCSSSLRSVQLI